MIVEYRNMVQYIQKMQNYMLAINMKLNQEIFKTTPIDTVPALAISPNILPQKHSEHSQADAMIEGLDNSIRSSASDDLNRE